MKLKSQSGIALDELLASTAAILLFPFLWILFCKGLDWSFWTGGLVAAACAYVSVFPFLLIWNWIRQRNEFLKEQKYRRRD